MTPVAVSLMRVVEYSRQMLQAARSADWERLVDLEQQRREPLALLAGELAGRAPRAEEAALMQEVLDADRAVGALAAERRADLAAGLDSAVAQRRLADAYGPG